MLGYKASHSKLKKAGIIANIFSDHNAVRLDISYKDKMQKKTNTWRLNNMLLNNGWINGKIKGEIRKYLKANESGNTTFQNLWDAAKAVQRGNFITL